MKTRITYLGANNLILKRREVKHELDYPHALRAAATLIAENPPPANTLAVHVEVEMPK